MSEVHAEIDGAPEAIRLSNEQQRVVDTWDQGMAVLAGAGSGKTSTLVVKCAELLKRNPKARFAAVSFTEKSARDLKNKLSQKLSLNQDGGALSGHWVMTIHGLCGAIIKEYPREAGFDGEETMLSETEAQLLWERACEGLWFEELPPTIFQALERLLDRESRTSLSDLLQRLRNLASFGVMHSLLEGESATADSRALREVGLYVLERYDRLKKRRGAVDFNDLERGAERALEFPEIQAEYQRRFDLIMVDEFQDTNPIQAKIIWNLVRKNATNLCVVGDPKQSIYRFRDADVSVFEDCCSRLPVTVSLTANFRSRPGIIEFCNQVCEPAFEASAMQYQALEAKKEPSAEFDPVVRLNALSPQDLGIWVRSEMDRGVPLSDMALLLRKIRGNEKWLKALTAAGIPIAVESGGLFWDDPRVREMTAFLKWWDNPGNELSGAIFLRSTWVGINDETLDLWRRLDPTWQKPFFASGHPIAQALLPFQNKAIETRPSELLMALLISQELEDELGVPLLGLWHRAEELSSMRLDFHGVVAEFTLSMAETRREKTVPPPRNQGQLIVLTLHGAKGLEFPHVILVDLPERASKASNAPLLYWDRTRGAYLGKRDENGEREKKDPVELAWKEDEKRKNLAESKRLFYVAVTRAEDRLVLVCPTSPPPDSNAAADADELLQQVGAETPTAEDLALYYEKDFWRGWIEACGAVTAEVTTPEQFELQLPGTAPTGAEAMAAESVMAPVRRPSVIAPTVQPVKRPRHSVTEWTTLSRCPRAYEWNFIRPVVVDKAFPLSDAKNGGEREVGQWTFPHAELNKGAEQETHESQFTGGTGFAGTVGLAQNELGTRVHACLETGNAEGLRELEREVGSERFQAAPVIEWMQNSPEMQGPSEVPSSGEVGLGGNSDRQVFPELAFEVPVAGEVLVGSIDRLTVDQGHYSIIDFKVTSRPKSDEDLLEAYETQLQLYRMALHILEPDSMGHTDAKLVNISANQIQTVEVPLTLEMDALETLARRASRIVQGEAGEPVPGKLCRVCDFRTMCPEGRAYTAG
ncbi:MAG: UvrD-helicase domain-containing protein [Methylotenera sp.]|nr:UvrD-helicase domain-containing protein [Oligoflexia bacterium]